MSKEIVYFDPHGARKFPHIAIVEEYLGGVGRLMFEDGTVQFAERDTYPDVVYSPRLSEVELEDFCKKNLRFYESYFNEYEQTFEHGILPPPIERFWE